MASSICAGRTAQHHVHGSFQYAFGCVRGLLADALSIENALILNADPSNAEEKGDMHHLVWSRKPEHHPQNRIKYHQNG